MKITLNTVQPKHEEYNIVKYLSHIFNLASLDKIIPNWDQGKITSWDRAIFWIQANLSKLPNIESASYFTSDLKDLKVEDIKQEFTEISNEELLSGR